MVEPDSTQWGDAHWRLANLYWITDETGKRIKFVPNEEQLQFLREFWHLNVILKARQLGFTTLIDLMILDNCIFSPNITAGIVAHNLDDAKKIFTNKIEFPWKNLPPQIREANPLVNDRMDLFKWANGSSVSVGASMRSGTLQMLHVSEFGKIARKDPEKAKEIRAGAFNAVHAGQFVAVESTAEGRGGDFYQIVQIAKRLRDARADLTPMDFKLHFYPWHTKTSYRLDPKGVPVPQYLREYFAEIKKARGIELDAWQRAWYVKKVAQLGNDHETMKQEFPSFEDEAFEAASDAQYFGKVMNEIRKMGRITDVPIILDRPVNTFWDIGRDMTSIWFHQYIGLQHRFINFKQDSGEELAHYLKMLKDLPYLYGTFFLPFDAEDQGINMPENTTLAARVALAWPGARIRVVPRVQNLGTSIDAGRGRLRECWFHEENCSEGIDSLQNFSKVWNEVTAMWKAEPKHDKYSHGASAWLKWVEGWDEQDSTPGGWAAELARQRGQSWGKASGRPRGDREAGY